MKKKCSKCQRTKDISSFSPTASICKGCNRQYMKERNGAPYQGLYVSCEAAIRRSRRTKGAYEHVSCQFQRPAEFRKAIWDNDELRVDWLKLWQSYVESGFDKDLRPTIDRIDAEASYTMDNIQFLPWGVHRIKDERKKMIDVFYNDEQGNLLVKRISYRDAKQEIGNLDDVLGEPVHVVDGKVFIQKASITVNPARLIMRDKEKDRQEAMMYLASQMEPDK